MSSLLEVALRQQNPDPVPGEQASEPHEDELDHDCEGSCLIRWKIGFAVILFLEAVIFGFALLVTRKLARSKGHLLSKIMHTVNAMGGGVFLSTGLLHILPEAIELLSSGEEGEENAEGEHGGEHDHGHEHGGEFPTAYAIVLLSFYVFFFVEQVVFSKFGVGHDHDVDVEANRASLSANDGGEDDYESHQEKERASLSFSGRHGFGSVQFLLSLVALFGIAAHSLFESIAMGASGSFSTVLNTFIAICAHRWATTIALGTKFVKDDLSWAPYCVLIVLFALVAPLGVGIGIGVNTASQTAQGVLFAISAATFIYIGAFEVPGEEFLLYTRHKFGRFCAMIGGAVIITIITVILVVQEVH